MDKKLNKSKKSDFIVCPSCGTLNSMENSICAKCKYKLKTWDSFDIEVELKNEMSKKGKSKARQKIKPVQKNKN